MRVRFHASARAEVREAARWYEERRENLGRDFREEVATAVDAIGAKPDTWPQVAGPAEARRYLLARFPFAVIYVLRGSDI